MDDIWTYWERHDTKQEPYFVDSDFLNEEMCNRLVEIQKNTKEVKGPVAYDGTYYPGVSPGVVNSDHRNVWASWLPWDNNEDIYKHIYHKAKQINDQYFGYEISGLQEIQLCRYEPGNFFAQHYDSFECSPKREFRKFTMSLLLSDPDDFEGSLDLYIGEMPIKIHHKKKGSAIFFPSSTLHAVEPINKGERRVAIAWFTGEKYR